MLFHLDALGQASNGRQRKNGKLSFSSLDTTFKTGNVLNHNVIEANQVM